MVTRIKLLTKHQQLYSLQKYDIEDIILLFTFEGKLACSTFLRNYQPTKVDDFETLISYPLYQINYTNYRNKVILQPKPNSEKNDLIKK